jgi:hypothetical protein
MASAAWRVEHRRNRLLAARVPEDLAYRKPHLEIAIQRKGTVVYEANNPISCTYFTHDAVMTVSLISSRSDGVVPEATSG